MKKCKKCNEFLEIESNFYKDKRIKGGYKNICKFCEGSTKINPTNILCKECDQNVEYSKYSIRTKQCKNCYSKLRKTKKSNSNKLRAINIIYNFLTEKTCSDCSLSKKIELFPIRKDSKDGHRNQCIECFGFKQSKGKKDYKQKNKRILRQKDIIYRKERMKNDPLYRAKMDARNIIRKSLSKKGVRTSNEFAIAIRSDFTSILPGTYFSKSVRIISFNECGFALKLYC